jgi:hemerythrin-like domain-containing protein
MPVQIGAKPHSFTDPTGLLADCHRRIEMFLDSLTAVAKVVDQSPQQETRRALENALRYFREAAPKHTADEEESLFPRLRRVRTAEVEKCLAKLEALEVDHRWAESLHAKVEKLGAEYLSQGALSAEQIVRFRQAIAELSAMYKRHIAVEDELLFPVASRSLSPAAKQAIAEEMAARREVKPMSLAAESRDLRA